MSDAGTARLVEALRALSAPEELPSLAAQAARLIDEAQHPGPPVVAHCVLLAAFARTEGRELAPEQWASVLNVAEAIADLCENGASANTVDRLGRAFRESLSPPAMH